MVNAPLADLRGEHRTEAVPPEPHRLVADIDPAFEQQIFNLPQRERIADVHHHREADHLGRAVEAAEGIAHRRRLWIAPSRLKPICFDNADRNPVWRGQAYPLAGAAQTARPQRRPGRVPAHRHRPESQTAGNARHEATVTAPDSLTNAKEPNATPSIDHRPPQPIGSAGTTPFAPSKTSPQLSTSSTASAKS